MSASPATKLPPSPEPRKVARSYALTGIDQLYLVYGNPDHRTAHVDRTVTVMPPILYCLCH